MHHSQYAGPSSLYLAIGSLEVWFSYQTPVAFRTAHTGLVIRENDWAQTTGKHLNAIDPDHKRRISGEEFEERWQSILGRLARAAADIGMESLS